MATNYATKLNTIDRNLVASAVQILAKMLEPYRNDAIISKSLFGLFTLRITIGQVLDWLVANFGQTPSEPVAGA